MDAKFLTVYRFPWQVHHQSQYASARRSECLIPDYLIRSAYCLPEGDRTRTF